MNVIASIKCLLSLCFWSLGNAISMHSRSLKTSKAPLASQGHDTSSFPVHCFHRCSSIEAFEQGLQLPVIRNETFTNLTEITTEIDEIAIDYKTTGQTIVQFPHMLNYLLIFTAITATVVVFGMLRALHGFRIVIQASKAFHMKMLDAVLRCPISFFDNNPIGKKINSNSM